MIKTDEFATLINSIQNEFSFVLKNIEKRRKADLIDDETYYKVLKQNISSFISDLLYAAVKKPVEEYENASQEELFIKSIELAKKYIQSENEKKELVFAINLVLLILIEFEYNVNNTLKKCGIKEEYGIMHIYLDYLLKENDLKSFNNLTKENIGEFNFLEKLKHHENMVILENKSPFFTLINTLNEKEDINIDLKNNNKELAQIMFKNVSIDNFFNLF